MNDVDSCVTIVIRPAVLADAEAIAEIFCESAAYHAALDAERYLTPSAETIAARYREGRQHPAIDHNEAITLVAERGSKILGFIDVRLEQSSDPMHQEMTYCHISEIAVSHICQNQGIGRRLLQSAEDWGRKTGATFASLEFHNGNTRASKFYQERMGYHAAAIIAIKRL